LVLSTVELLLEIYFKAIEDLIAEISDLPFANAFQNHDLFFFYQRLKKNYTNKRCTTMNKSRDLVMNF